jgi:hypothetical protein
MAGVITQRDRRTILSPNTAVRAQNQKFRIAQSLRIPAHTGILRQPE